MNLPFLGESVCLTDLARVLSSLGPVVPFDVRCVDLPTGCRGFQEGRDHCQRPKDNGTSDSHDPALFPGLVNRGVAEVRGHDASRIGRASRSRFLLLRNRHGIGLLDGDPIGGMLVASKEDICPSVRPLLHFVDHALTVLGSSLPWYEAQKQAVLRVNGGVVPIIPLEAVQGIRGVAIVFFLADETPSLVHLGRTGPRGKKRPVLHGVSGHACQQARHIASPCPCLSRPVGLLAEFRNLLGYAPEPQSRSLSKVGTAPEQSPSAPRNAHRKSGSKPSESSSSDHSIHGMRDFPSPEARNRGIWNSGSRSARSGAFAVSETETDDPSEVASVSNIGSKPTITLAISGHHLILLSSANLSKGTEAENSTLSSLRRRIVSSLK